MAKKEPDLETRVERVCAEMMALCCVLLFTATAYSWHIGLQANNVAHSLYHASENLKGIQKTIALMETQRR